MKFWVGVTDKNWFEYLSGIKPDEVNFWKHMLVSLCGILGDLHRDDFSMIFGLKGRKKPYFTRDESQLTEPSAIPNTDIFVETCWSANQTVKLCYRLIDLFGYSDDDLKVEVKDE